MDTGLRQALGGSCDPTGYNSCALGGMRGAGGRCCGGGSRTSEATFPASLPSLSMSESDGTWAVPTAWPQVLLANLHGPCQRPGPKYGSSLPAQFPLRREPVLDPVEEGWKSSTLPLSSHTQDQSAPSTVSLIRLDLDRAHVQLCWCGLRCDCLPPAPAGVAALLTPWKHDVRVGEVIARGGGEQRTHRCSFALIPQSRGVAGALTAI
jgi:hypothetical protein